MLKFSKKPINYCEGRASETSFKLQIDDYSYNNGIYKINCTVMSADPYLVNEEDEFWPKEYAEIFHEVFKEDNAAFCSANHSAIYAIPVITAKISFSVPETGVIKTDDDTIHFKHDNMDNFNLEIVDVKLHNIDGDNDINSILATTDLTSALLNHPKGKEIIDYFKGCDETFYSLMPGYGEDLFPNQWTEGFEYTEE